MAYGTKMLKNAVQDLLDYYFVQAEKDGEVDWDTLDSFMKGLQFAHGLAKTKEAKG